MLEQSPLGHKTVYIENYDSSLLFPLPRALGRQKLGNALPSFTGEDLWCGYELSWLNSKGKPQVAIANFSFGVTSPDIIESKSFKLYLNSFNQSRFNSAAEVQKILSADLSAASQADVAVQLYSIHEPQDSALKNLPGICLDLLDVEIDHYTVDKQFLTVSSSTGEAPLVEETVYSDLLKSNCLATGQPDWGSVMIRYRGEKIDHANLLKYIISYRKHSGFAEHCVEQMFTDIWSCCKLEKLTVYCRYTRRGGLEINSWRSNFESPQHAERQVRQ